MTGDQHAAIVHRANTDRDPALLSGTSARVVMFVLSEVLVIAPMLLWVPEFEGWRAVLGFIAALAMAAAGPAIALLIPRAVQEEYRQALIESEERRAKLNSELVRSREFAATLRASSPPTEAR